MRPAPTRRISHNRGATSGRRMLRAADHQPSHGSGPLARVPRSTQSERSARGQILLRTEDRGGPELQPFSLRCPFLRGNRQVITATSGEIQTIEKAVEEQRQQIKVLGLSLVTYQVG